MILNKTHKIVLSVAIILMLLGGYVYFDRRSKNSLSVLENMSATTTSELPGKVGDKITVQGPNGSYTIEQVPITEGTVPQSIPDLDRPLTPSANATVSLDAKTLAARKVSERQSLLKKDPGNLPAWLDLGMYQKMGGDFEGTVISWTYATKLSRYHVAFSNLGNLYAYFLHDIDKSLSYYKQAIAIAPNQAYI